MIKKGILFVAAVFVTKLTMAQGSCCMKSNSGEAFAMLTHNKQFVAAHLDPKPFALENPMGQDISVKSSDGQDAHAYEIKAAKPSKNYVLVFHEWWGLNDYIKQEAERIYKNLGDVNVIAIDLYDRKVATVKDSAAKYMQSVNAERAQKIIQAVLAYMGNDVKVATIGWCFGGGWSMQASLLAEKKSKACVMYYGMPEDKMEKIKTLNPPVLFIWPELDQWINKDIVSKFEANMKTAKKTLTVKQYNANHAFANPSNPIYNKEFADDAFAHAMTFIKANLK